MKKEFILLTKSKKYGAYCISGVDTTTKDWIRIVHPHGGPIKKWEICYDDGSEAECLDIIEVDCVCQDDITFQPENHVISSGKKWKRVGRERISILKEISAKDQAIHEKIFFDEKYKLADDYVKTLGKDQLYSLMMIKVNEPYLFVNEIKNQEYPKGILSFRYIGNWYSYFRITDMDFLKRIGNKDYKECLEGEYYLVISLGENFQQDNCHYKLVAKIYEDRAMKNNYV